MLFGLYEVSEHTMIYSGTLVNYNFTTHGSIIKSIHSDQEVLGTIPCFAIGFISCGDYFMMLGLGVSRLFMHVMSWIVFRGGPYTLLTHQLFHRNFQTPDNARNVIKDG